MLPMTSRINLIINQLKNRLDSVVSAGNSLPTSYSLQDWRVKDFETNVSHLIHYIVSTTELRYELEELLKYKQKAKESKHFTRLISKVSTNIKDLGEYISGLSSFKTNSSRVDQNMGQLASIFVESYFATSSTEDFIKIMATGPDVSNFDRYKFRTLSELLYKGDNLNSICEYWLPQSELNTHLLTETLESLKEIELELTYIEEYEYQFTKADVADELMRFYLATNPRYERTLPHNLYFLKAGLNNSSIKVDVHKYVNYCQKLYEYLINNLSARLSKKAILERFKAYIEVFRASDYVGRDTVGEKEFQKVFEEFIFFHGLFPLTEVALGNGRLDTLSLSGDQAFLCELKQVGFEVKTETSKTVNTKVKLGMQEPTIYHSRLADFPNLLPEIHVVIFSRVAIRLTKDEVTINGLHYYFYIINLTDNSPSKQKNVEVINPETLFLESPK